MNDCNEDRFRTALSYDDVLLVPKRTRLSSRKDADTSTQLTPRLRLAIPIVSANAPFCTEDAMAIMMAKLGGVGFIHRMATVAQQAAQVARTKRAEWDPEEHPCATVDGDGRLAVGAAVGIRGDCLRRADNLVRQGVDCLVVNVAHGHSDDVIRVVGRFRETYPHVVLVAGNVATAEGVKDLAEAGADVVKVGIGPGAICTTRLVTGAGVPQFTAVLECARLARDLGVTIIADGGVRQAGDVTKALGAGASAVMLGTMLAGTDESAAVLIEENGRKYKRTTGFASLGAELTLRRAAGEALPQQEMDAYVPEGIEAEFLYTGPLRHRLLQIVGGLRSGMSYAGAASICELRSTAEFLCVTPAGREEGSPHALRGPARAAGHGPSGS